jgi:hypothetical protein
VEQVCHVAPVEILFQFGLLAGRKQRLEQRALRQRRVFRNHLASDAGDREVPEKAPRANGSLPTLGISTASVPLKGDKLRIVSASAGQFCGIIPQESPASYCKAASSIAKSR